MEKQTFHFGLSFREVTRSKILLLWFSKYEFPAPEALAKIAYDVDFAVY